MPTSELREDLNAAFEWHTILEVFDDFGVLERRETVYDSGFETIEFFEFSFLVTLAEYDRAPDGGASAVWPWEWRAYSYEPGNPGVLESTYVLWDDGLTEQSNYFSGDLRSIIQTDPDTGGIPSSVKPWSTIEQYFADDGTLRYRIVERDDGTRIVSTYEDGVLYSVDRRDLDYDGGTSSAQPWTQAFTIFEPNGDIDQRAIDFDTGMRQLERFEGGVLRSLLREDAPGTDGISDVFDWERIEITYDAAGVRLSREVTYDTGIVLENIYEDGALRTSTQRDLSETGGASDVKPWESMVTTFAATGDIERRETLFDNGDIAIILFEEGDRSARLQVDGDGSNLWAARETLFDAAGGVAEVNLYDTLEEISPDYGFAVPM